ncbi:hypothetical protein BDV32DRAFT_133448 [Aspergillus pseudonomiae]|nr:hypothetical protein BDV32DRAFT_133448 [Aspergillus pseudonomiae]
MTTGILCPPQILRTQSPLHLSSILLCSFYLYSLVTPAQKIASSPNLNTHFSRHSGPKEDTPKPNFSRVTETAPVPPTVEQFISSWWDPLVTRFACKSGQ